MKKLLLPLLLAVVLSTACDDDPSPNPRYNMDGEFEIWSATIENGCFMLDLGPPNYDATFESDAAREQYEFWGSDNGERCWPRTYERVGNELTLVETIGVDVFEGTCSVTIQRERNAVFSSNDTFIEVSTVEVSCAEDAGCPPDLITCLGVDQVACTAEFNSVGLRCSDCWQGCVAAAQHEDPLLEAGAASAP
jgi:hypothetical protein